MQTWRGFVVILVAAIGGFAAMFTWLVMFALPEDGHDVDPFASLEGTAVCMAGIFYSGQAAARLLIGTRDSEEIARSGSARLVPLHFLLGVIFIAARPIAGFRPLWTWRYGVVVALGLGLLSWAGFDLWRYLIKPYLHQRARRRQGG